MRTDVDIASLYRARHGVVDIVDVPELWYLVVRGRGAPEGPEFTAAIQALFAVSYGAHFALKKASGSAPHVMPLEALWSPVPDDRSRWRWQAMILQPDPIDDDVVRAAWNQASAKNLPALDKLSFERWTEGRCAQTLHIGPYADETATMQSMQREIRDWGYRSYGMHHEIYLSDPRRCAPERLRTILRQPIAPA